MRTAGYGEPVGTDDPWGWGRSLEWATSCPPPRHNFRSLPRIRSESPAFDLRHPTPAVPAAVSGPLSGTVSKLPDAPLPVTRSDA